jgi:CheY-like chemotaxis protein
MPVSVSIRVLVVDDEPGVRALVWRTFSTQTGIEIVQAQNGAHAIERLLEQPCDLVLLDLTMPVMGGLETLEIMRRHPALKQVPVLVLTGRADEDRIRRAIDLGGIIGCLAKPFAIGELRARVKAFAEARRRPDGSLRRHSSPLSLSPQDVVLLVERNPDVQAIARDALQRICVVETAPNEFAALTRCGQMRFRAIVLGLLTDWSAPADVVGRFRQLPGFDESLIVAAPPPTMIEAVREADCCDAIMPRRLSHAEYERATAAILDLATRSRLLVHPDSPWLNAAFADLAGEFAGPFGSVTAEAGVLSHAPARSVVVSVEIHGAHVDRLLTVRHPLPAALTLAVATSSVPIDAVSDAQIRDGAHAFARRIAAALATRAAEVALPWDVGDSVVELAGPEGLRSIAPATPDISYRFIAPSGEVGSVGLVPLAAAGRAD